MGMPDKDIVLLTYDTSVHGRKIDWYLTLRGIPYYQCIQPNRLPRPDLEALGIDYRRIPILLIGRDVYCDSRLIIDKFEKFLPESTLGSKNQFEQGLEKILSIWSMDGGPLWRAVQCIPPDADVMKDPEWLADRSAGIGQDFTPELLTKVRCEATAHLKIYLETIEHGMLADGREFLLATEKPTLSDLHIVWVFDWLTGKSMNMGKSLDPDVISESQYPRVYAWIARFRAAVDAARQEHGDPNIMSGEDAVSKTLGDDFWEKEGCVDELDPLRLQKGQLVDVYPTDFGSTHRDRGELVMLGTREVVIKKKVQNGDGFLRLHFPRINFRIEPVQ